MSIKFQFEEFKAGLKEKWLEYYDKNCYWIDNVALTWYETEFEGYIPDATFILAVVSSLEPQLQEFLPVLSDLNSDTSSLVIALGLNFNPKLEIKKRTEERARIQAIETIPLLPESDAEYLNKIRQENIT
jgi:hypothetical protein